MFKDLNIKIVNIDEYEFLELLEKSSKLEHSELRVHLNFKIHKQKIQRKQSLLKKVETLPEEEKEEVTKIETQELTKTQKTSKQRRKQNNIIDIAYLNATANNNNNEAETKPSENFNMAKLPFCEETQETKEEEKDSRA